MATELRGIHRAALSSTMASVAFFSEIARCSVDEALLGRLKENYSKYGKFDGFIDVTAALIDRADLRDHAERLHLPSNREGARNAFVGVLESKFGGAGCWVVAPTRGSEGIRMFVHFDPEHSDMEATRTAPMIAPSSRLDAGPRRQAQTRASIPTPNTAAST